MDTNGTYLVTDIEADGLTLGTNSMLSFATVAIDGNGTDRGRFSVNLQPLEGASADPDTMAWWRTQPEAWAEATRDPRPASEAIGAFVDWARTLDEPRVFVAHPAWFDARWIAWYLDRFASVPLYDTPYQQGLTIGAIDLPTLVMGVHGWSYERCNRRNYPDSWLGGYAHSHRAIDDALGYAHLLALLLEQRSGARSSDPDSAGQG